MNKFDDIIYEDDHFTDDDYIFLNPSRQFQEHLNEIMQLCDWRAIDLMNILSVSKSTCNNILGNDSMTNSKPTPIHKTDLITLLMCIQQKKIKYTHSLLVFYLFSILCPGMPVTLDFEPFKKLSVLEKDLPPDLLLQNLNCLCPDTIRSFNRFIEWRLNKPEVTITEYYGRPELNEYVQLEFDDNEPMESEIRKSLEYFEKFIPLYLDWYISKICKWCR